LKVFEGLHILSGAEYFLTTDKKILNKAIQGVERIILDGKRRISLGKIRRAAWFYEAYKLGMKSSEL
jgi:hypothetical protein